MPKKTHLILLSTILPGLLAPAHALGILMVTNNTGTTQSLNDFLVAEGHTVTRDARITGPGDLTGIDLVIVARESNSGDYSQAPEPAEWNALTIPIINMAPHITRNTRFGWTSGTGLSGGDLTDYNAYPDDTHPYIKGLSTTIFSTSSTFTAPPETEDLPTGSTVVATAAGARYAIWHTPAGAAMFDADATPAGADRVGFIRGNEGSWNNITADGEQILRNIIKGLTGPPPTDSDGDSLDDQWEIDHFGDLTRTGGGDEEPDGATNLQEFDNATDPNDGDTDDDTLSDGDEINTHGTNPKIGDTDFDTIGDAEEVVDGADGFTTNPNDKDTDGDSWNDGFEVTNVAAGFDPTVDDGAEDPDSDDLDNDGEAALNTDPLNPDSDDDGLNDGPEEIAGTDPNDPDSDDDGLLDGVEDNGGIYVSETQTGTDPLIADTDNDLIDDGVEVANIGLGLDPTVDNYFDDTDGDTITNGNEVEVTLTNPLLADTDDDGIDDNVEDTNMDGFVDLDETDANDPDTDDDGLLDGVEDGGGSYGGPGMTGTDPLDPDTDGDLIDDGIEVANAALGLDPNVDDYEADTDGDTISNGEEIEYTLTDFLVADTDGDGLNDNIEDVNLDGVVDAGETDANNADTDGDCLADGVEDGGGVLVSPAMTGTDPLVADGLDDDDGDGFAFATEVLYGTDPALLADSPAGLLPDILFVGGNETGDMGSDDEVQHFLRCRYGVEAVTYVQSNASTAADADGRDLLVLSSTPGSGDLRTKFPSVAVPTINWEEAVADNGIGEFGTSAEVMTKSTTVTQIDLMTHVITDGLPSTIDLFRINPTNRETYGTLQIFPGLGHLGTAIGGTGTAGPGNGQPVDGMAMIVIADTGDALDPGAGVTGNVAPARRVMFLNTDNTFANFSLDAQELFGRTADWAMGLLVETPGRGDITATGAFQGAAFEVTAENLDSTVTYELRRSADGLNFSTVAESTFTGASTHVFVDPAPPAGGTQLYQIWTP